ncbi:UDP-N-acetylglucosamine 1-carboxyvinyltransferase [Calderihabitans maritimus]|uniref:UDP-N-acetylglucosamine 1-carboxyvinyltransferase n=1 Tax=Calderihabitans maritimus TaxID=1246530 RepID=A0A1Z5HWU9_9FIRM|nr:UDP-N-acetylglucosamine 1-carboxyvinyltransferase [Calderihabitans maritimus]GAW93760.1 UDP-N-acetylglucosamine 1-carboxyvinyltransferase [Calderihabitans maritimus]
MARLIIDGGKRLQGKVRISGAKNAALAIIAASVMAEGETILENVPCIADVEYQLDIISGMGAEVKWLDPNTVRLVVPDTISSSAPYRLVKKLRASNLLLGALLARKGMAEVPLPGGCDIGARPMDLHFKGLTALGAEIRLKHGFVVARGNCLSGTRIYLDFPSVGATENIMMAACRASGVTVIENAAKEPEVVDLANFLNAMGAKVRGAGTDLIKIEGVSDLRGVRYAVIPDRIEAGTYMIAAAATGGDVWVDNIIATHLQPIIAKLQEVGAVVEEKETAIRVIGREKLFSTDVKTLPYPGFPTDLQSPMMSLLAVAKGTSIIRENIFENRLQVAEELKRMGASVKVEGQVAVIVGVEQLYGARVNAPDLRAGAALVIAGLMAEGTTEVLNASVIHRGYEHLKEKLTALGASIQVHT